MPVTPGLIDAAAQTGQNLVNTGLGLVLEKHNDARQLRQQGKLQNLQIQGQEQLTDYNMGKQLDLWKQTSYPAQMEQLEKAGLNPGLLYGQGGGGGQTASIAQGSVSSGEAPKGGGEIMGMALMRAQIQNIQANTQKTVAEAQNVPKTGANIDASTSSLLQGIENQKAQQALTEMQTSIASIEEEIKGKTQNVAIAMAQTELAKQTAVMHSLEAQGNIDQKTMNDKIQIIRQQAMGAVLQNEYTRAGINKTKQETDSIANQMTLVWAQLENSKDQTAIARQLADFETKWGKEPADILKQVFNKVKL